MPQKKSSEMKRTIAHELERGKHFILWDFCLTAFPLATAPPPATWSSKYLLHNAEVVSQWTPKGIGWTGCNGYWKQGELCAYLFFLNVQPGMSPNSLEFLESTRKKEILEKKQCGKTLWQVPLISLVLRFQYFFVCLCNQKRYLYEAVQLVVAEDNMQMSFFLHTTIVHQFCRCTGGKFCLIFL